MIKNGENYTKFLLNYKFEENKKSSQDKRLYEGRRQGLTENSCYRGTCSGIYEKFYIY